MTGPLIFLTTSAEETQKAGREIAVLLKPGDVVCLTGELGAGKTTLIKGIAEKLGGINPLEVTSPTFTYLHTYPGSPPLHHFDLYRLASSEQFLSLGFTEFFGAGGICCIEWPEKIPQELSFSKVCIDLTYLSAQERNITFQRFYDKK
ncbi:MAG: tRNA (adenosine(37)-N6)-threonylcarbamoyltransferase complex ATPase subunit type 1 TsaE [Rhabdochlamydiaceae bacterium]|nr:tRNA (adenosine(37)-N6)-threonylcarbamoyltransferase complex ATPase subunit type 1 TsaE [Rhabdochlamydiaceae bacterium]